MKKIIMIVLMLAMTALYAEGDFKGLSENNNGRFGVGLGGSSHVGGLSAKLYLSDKMAVQGAIGSTYSDGFAGNVDVVLQMTQLIKGNKDFLLPLYIGAGVDFWSWSGTTYVDGRLKDETSFILGASGVVGLALQFKEFPLELSTEIRPTFFLGDYGGFHIYGGGAIRWFF